MSKFRVLVVGGYGSFGARLVEMLAGGNHTYVQIAEELGLTETYVGKVARGEGRPETPYGVTTNRTPYGATTNGPGETPKGRYPLESAPTDEAEAEKGCSPWESEVSEEQAVAGVEAHAEGQGRDGAGR